MHPRIALLTPFVCLIMVTLPTAGAPPRSDRYGDPLPPGVVARLGTKRLTLADSVNVLTFSPDGRRLAVYNTSEQLRVWEVDSGKELLHIKGRPIRWHGRLVYSPDGKTLAMGYGGWTAGTGKVCVWEAGTGKELHHLGGRLGQRMPSSICFSPDGRSLFAGGHDRPILCWDLSEGGAPRRIGDFSSALFAALSRDGKTVTTASYDSRDGQKWTFARWDIAGGKEVGRRTMTLSGEWSPALSPEGSLFARPEKDGKSIMLLDPLTGREISRAQGCDYPVNLAFSADGSLMTCGSKDGNVRVWDTATGKLRARFRASSTSIDCIALSPDGKRLALTGRADCAIHVWDVAAGRELHSFAGHRGRPLTVAFLNDGKEIASVSRDSSHTEPVNGWADWSLRRWDAATGAERAVTRANPKGEVHFTAFSPDGRQLATVVHDGTLHLWDVPGGKELRSWKVPTWESTLKSTWIDGKVVKKPSKMPHPAITGPTFSPDGKMILAARGNKIHRWEAATGRELPIFEIEGISLKERLEHSWCHPSPDGRTLALLGVIDRFPPILLLDAANGKIKQRLKAAPTHWHQLAFSADGRTFAIGESDGVTFWEVASGQRRGRLRGPQSTFSLAFSPDGRFLAVGEDKDSPLSLWDLATGRLVGRLQADCGWVRQVAFSPDGSRLAVAGYSTTVLVCDVAELCGKKKMEEIAKIAAPSAEEFEGLWAELSGADGARAYRAIRRLGLAGSRGAEFLKARLKGRKPPDEKRIAQFIADLDDAEFSTREKASAELDKLGVQAEPALRRTLKSDVSAEVRMRIKRLLERVEAIRGPLPSPELVRLRGVEALEANGTKEARQALTDLADGRAHDPLTREAKASLARLRSSQVHSR